MTEHDEQKEPPLKIFRINVLGYMVNCANENKPVIYAEIIKFCTNPRCEPGRSRITRLINDFIKFGYIRRVKLGKYQIIQAFAIKDELAAIESGMSSWGNKRILDADNNHHSVNIVLNSKQDGILDYIDLDKPSRKTYRVNVLRHMLNLYNLGMPIRSLDFYIFSACASDAAMQATSCLMRTLINLGAIRHKGKQGYFDVIDVRKIKIELTTKERSIGIDQSFPGMARPFRVSSCTDEDREQWREYKRRIRSRNQQSGDKTSTLDSIMFNLGR